MPHDNISQLGVDDILVFKGMCVFLFLSCKYTISELIVLILHTISLHLDAFSLFCNGSFHDYKQYNCSGVWFWDPRQHSHVSAFLNSSIYSWERFEQTPCLNSLRGHFVCVFAAWNEREPDTTGCWRTSCTWLSRTRGSRTRWIFAHILPHRHSNVVHDQ